MPMYDMSKTALVKLGSADPVAPSVVSLLTIATNGWSNESKPRADES